MGTETSLALGGRLSVRVLVKQNTGQREKNSWSRTKGTWKGKERKRNKSEKGIRVIKSLIRTRF